MTESVHLWHIRLPDGRAFRAAASAIRQHILSGRIPPEVELRRSSTEEWQPLQAFTEFANLKRNGHSAPTGSWSDFQIDGAAKPQTVASRVDPAQLGLPGAKLLLEELVAALDSLLVFRKALATGCVALMVAVLVFVAVLPLPDPVGVWVRSGCVGVAALLELGLMALLTRMVFIEVSRMRRARIRDGYVGMPGVLWKLVLLWGCAVGGVLGASWGLRQVPELLASAVPEVPAVVAVCGLLLALVECVLWGLVVFLGPMAAILVVEDCSLREGLATWTRLLTDQGWRLFVSQWLTLGLAGLALLPLGVLLAQIPGGGPLPVALVGTVAVAYLSVANVFLYLHLRYERD